MHTHVAPHPTMCAVQYNFVMTGVWHSVRVSLNVDVVTTMMRQYRCSVVAVYCGKACVGCVNFCVCYTYEAGNAAGTSGEFP